VPCDGCARAATLRTGSEHRLTSQCEAGAQHPEIMDFSSSRLAVRCCRWLRLFAALCASCGHNLVTKGASRAFCAVACLHGRRNTVHITIDKMLAMRPVCGKMTLDIKTVKR